MLRRPRRRIAAQTPLPRGRHRVSCPGPGRGWRRRAPHRRPRPAPRRRRRLPRCRLPCRRARRTTVRLQRRERWRCAARAVCRPGGARRSRQFHAERLRDGARRLRQQRVEIGGRERLLPELRQHGVAARPLVGAGPLALGVDEGGAHGLPADAAEESALRSVQQGDPHSLLRRFSRSTQSKRSREGQEAVACLQAAAWGPRGCEAIGPTLSPSLAKTTAGLSSPG